jgi:hypothetical protein
VIQSREKRFQKKIQAAIAQLITHLDTTAQFYQEVAPTPAVG